MQIFFAASSEHGSPLKPPAPNQVTNSLNCSHLAEDTELHQNKLTDLDLETLRLAIAIGIFQLFVKIDWMNHLSRT